MENYKIIYLLISVPFVIHNLIEWWSGKVKDNKWKAQLDNLKLINKTYYLVIMILISLIVIPITSFLFPIYATDLLCDRVLFKMKFIQNLKLKLKEKRDI